MANGTTTATTDDATRPPSPRPPPPPVTTPPEQPPTTVSLNLSPVPQTPAPGQITPPDLPQPVQPGRAADVGPDISVQPHYVASMPDRTTPQGQALWAMATPAGRALIGPESSWSNQAGPMTSSGQAQGFYQITTGTWNDFAPRAGVDLRQYPTPMSAPFAVQQQVADTIPLARWETKDALKRQYPWARDDMTLGQINRFAGGAGALVDPELRGPSQWGKPGEDWFNGQPGMMPKPDQGFAGTLMKFAVPLLGIASLAAGGGLTVAVTAYGAMKKAERDGEILPYIQNKQKWEASLAAQQAQQQMESTEAGDAMAAYANDPDGLKLAMTGIANKYQDRPLMAAIEQGPDAINRLQSRRDMLNQPLMKTQLAIEKMQLEQANADAAQRLREANYNLSVDRNNLARQKEQREAAAQAAAAAEKAREFNAQHGGSVWGLPDQAAPAPATTTPAPQTGVGTTAAPQPPPDTTTPAPQPPAPQQPDQTEQPNTDATGETQPPLTATPQQQTQRQDLPPPTQLAAAGQSDVPEDPTAQAARAAAQQPPPAPQEQPPPPPQPLTPAEAVQFDPPPTLKDANGRPVPIPPAVENLGRWMFRGGKPTAETDKAAVNAAEMYANYLRSQTDKIAKQPNLTGQALVDKVRQLDQGTGDLLQDVLQSKREVPAGGGFGAEMAPFWSNVVRLAAKAQPGWRPFDYQAAKEFEVSYNADKPMGVTLQRSFRMMNVAKELIADAAKLPPGPLPMRVWEQMFANGWSSNPLYKKFAADWRNFAIESNAVASGGRPTVSLTNSLINILEGSGGAPDPRQLRAAVQSDVNNALGAVDTAVGGWHATFPDKSNPALYNQATYSALWQIANMNPDTGELGSPPPAIGTRAQWGGQWHTYRGGNPNDQSANWTTD